MKLENIIIRTEPVRAGMHVYDVIRECAKHRVHALPYCDESGRITGRVTLKNIMRLACLPEHMVELAQVLGSQLSCLQNAEKKVHEVLSDPIEPFVLAPPDPTRLSAPVMKALALMEQHDTSYLFIVDNGRYVGLVTIQGIAQRMLELEDARNDAGQSVVS